MAAGAALTVDGLTLEAAHWPGAAGAGPTLVLLHEGLGCVTLWKDFPAALAARTGLDVFAYSRDGYGNSSPATLPRPLDYMERHAREVLPEVLARQGGPSYVLLGHSDGASIAIAHAGARRDPKLRALVLVAPHVVTEAVTVETIGRAQADYAAGALRRRLARHHGDNVDCAFHGWSGAWTDPGFRTWSLEPCLSRIEVPVLAIRGGADPYSSDAHVRLIEAGVAGPVETLSLEGCGHAPHLERPDAVLARVAEFVATCGAG